MRVVGSAASVERVPLDQTLLSERWTQARARARIRAAIAAGHFDKLSYATRIAWQAMFAFLYLSVSPAGRLTGANR